MSSSSFVPEPIRINPNLDLTKLAASYRLKNRLQIRDFLVPQSAEALHKLLQTLSWSLAYNQGTQVIQLGQERLVRLTRLEFERIREAVRRGAVEGFQFCYSLFPLLSAYFDPSAPFHPIFGLFEWLNGPEFLGFVRTVTGLEQISWADGQATSYGPGNFLKYHTDETPSQQREAAYVLNFTPNWGRDWGGQLQFFDENYDVEQGLRPLFNAINLFTVPMDHSVSMVVPYAPRSRMSVTGWLRSDSPPGAIPWSR